MRRSQRVRSAARTSLRSHSSRVLSSLFAMSAWACVSNGSKREGSRIARGRSNSRLQRPAVRGRFAAAAGSVLRAAAAAAEPPCR